MLAGMPNWLREQFRTLFQEDIPKKVRTGIAASLVALTGFVLWRCPWQWLSHSFFSEWSHSFGVDPELGRQGGLLSVRPALLVRVAGTGPQSPDQSATASEWSHCSSLRYESRTRHYFLCSLGD